MIINVGKIYNIGSRVAVGKNTVEQSVIYVNLECKNSTVYYLRIFMFE